MAFLKAQIISTLLSLALLLIAFAVSRKKGFFLLQISKKIFIKTKTLVFSYTIFIATQLAISTIGLFFYKTFSFSVKNPVVLLAYSAILSQLVIATCFISLIKKTSALHALIGQKDSIGTHIYKGFISWLVAFPLLLFTIHLVLLVQYLLTGLEKLPKQPIIKFLLSLSPYPVTYGILCVIIVVVVPFVEEFLFRGILQNWFKRFATPFWSILCSSLIFAIMHITFKLGLLNITILVPLFILSIFLGFLYEKYQSILVPMVLHGLFNGLSILQLLIMGADL